MWARRGFRRRPLVPPVRRRTQCTTRSRQVSATRDAHSCEPAVHYYYCRAGQRARTAIVVHAPPAPRPPTPPALLVRLPPVSRGWFSRPESGASSPGAFGTPTPSPTPTPVHVRVILVPEHHRKSRAGRRFDVANPSPNTRNRLRFSVMISINLAPNTRRKRR